MVSGYHYRAYTGRAALLYGCFNFRAHRVNHTCKAYEAKLPLKELRGVVLRFFCPKALRRRQHPECFVRHVFIYSKYLTSLAVRQRLYTSVFNVMRTAFKDFLRRALRILDKFRPVFMDRTHHLPHRVERRLVNARIFRFHSALFDAKLNRIIYKRRLSRLALGFAVLIKRGVVAHRHGACEKPLVTVVLNDGHFILRKCSRFVRTDYLSAAERFHRCQPAYNGVAFAHVCNAYGKYNRNNCGKPFGYGCNGKRNGNHEGRKDGI